MLLRGHSKTTFTKGHTYMVKKVPNLATIRVIIVSTDIHTVALDCYDTPKMLILVFIKFRENQEW